MARGAQPDGAARVEKPADAAEPADAAGPRREHFEHAGALGRGTEPKLQPSPSDTDPRTKKECNICLVDSSTFLKHTFVAPNTIGKQNH